MAATVIILARLGLVVVFGFAGISKLGDIRGFAYDIHRFELTSWVFSYALANYLPWVEIIFSIGLCINRFRSGALWGTFLLGLIFSIAIAAAWVRGFDLSCGCFGKSTQASHLPWHLAGTFAIMLGSAWLWRRQQGCR